MTQAFLQFLCHLPQGRLSLAQARLRLEKLPLSGSAFLVIGKARASAALVRDRYFAAAAGRARKPLFSLRPAGR
jgi:hypothetical protein